jgi:hypothetical protein
VWLIATTFSSRRSDCRTHLSVRSSHAWCQVVLGEKTGIGLEQLSRSECRVNLDRILVALPSLERGPDSRRLEARYSAPHATECKGDAEVRSHCDRGSEGAHGHRARSGALLAASVLDRGASSVPEMQVAATLRAPFVGEMLLSRRMIARRVVLFGSRACSNKCPTRPPQHCQ